MNSLTSKGEERRGLILKAALELFSTQGFEGTTTRQIATRAGLTEAGLFRYFATKKELFRAVIKEHGPQHHFIPPVDSSVLENVPIRSLLLFGLNWYLDTFWEHRALFRMMVIEAWRDTEATEELRMQFDEHQNHLVLALEEGARRGEFRTGVAEAASDLIASALGGFLLRSIQNEPEDWAAARTTFVQHIMSIVFEGILQPS